ncbi:branched-chain amino acid transport system permease protein [Camelimonas lactis]|uniref:Branched-chain amino acid transport system permease protein n=2 Tax=Camelimonas lactis TaxID=659006 RepID=A0A4R2GKX5_9HYPH|nr:branched-chain amino acid transport system permease protein [Camelimonas lactis]
MRNKLASPYAPPVIIAASIVLISCLPLTNFQVRMATLLFIFSTVVLGKNLLMGYAGQISLGHGAFFGLGAYTVAIGAARYGLSPWLLTAMSLPAAGVIAWIIGRPILKLRGYHLAMATLAFGSIFAMVLTNAVHITGGPDGMALDMAAVRLFGMTPRWSWYWICGGVLVLAMYLLASLLDSPTGREMRAIHDSEIAAGVLGIDVAQAKLRAFVISAVFTTLAGCCFVMFDRYITPQSAGILRSIEFVTMTVVGGLGSAIGSIIGAAIFVVLPQFLTVFHEYEQAILGLILVIIMVLLPKGIAPSLAGWLRSRRASSC